MGIEKLFNGAKAAPSLSDRKRAVQGAVMLRDQLDVSRRDIEIRLDGLKSKSGALLMRKVQGDEGAIKEYDKTKIDIRDLSDELSDAHEALSIATTRLSTAQHDLAIAELDDRKRQIGRILNDRDVAITDMAKHIAGFADAIDRVLACNAKVAPVIPYHKLPATCLTTDELMLNVKLELSRVSAALKSRTGLKLPGALEAEYENHANFEPLVDKLAFWNDGILNKVIPDELREPAKSVRLDPVSEGVGAHSLLNESSMAVSEAQANAILGPRKRSLA